MANNFYSANDAVKSESNTVYRFVIDKQIYTDSGRTTGMTAGTYIFHYPSNIWLQITTYDSSSDWHHLVEVVPLLNNAPEIKKGDKFYFSDVEME